MHWIIEALKATTLAYYNCPENLHPNVKSELMNAMHSVSRAVEYLTKKEVA